jgi:hypothetical protein
MFVGDQGSGHGVIFLVWSGAGFDLVAQDEVGSGVTGSGSGEVFTQLRDGVVRGPDIDVVVKSPTTG